MTGSVGTDDRVNCMISGVITLNNNNGKNKSPEEVLCPACGGASDTIGDVPGWGHWQRCRVCTLEFADPLTLGRDPKVLFDEAYRGRVETNAMTDFYRRVEQRRVILEKIKDPTLWFWTPAFNEVLDWLKRECRPGATVLELGCGLGFFLHAMRNEGFNAVGLDVAETVVELNRKDGFQVWHGPIESMPVGWVKPDAVVSFFMLHHLENPNGFLRAIRERAPNASVAIAVYGPSNTGTDASLPPRTLIRWNGPGLAAALSRAGYQVRVQDLQSTGAESQVFDPIRKTLAKTMALPSVYRFGKAVESRVLPKLPGQIKHDSYVVLAFGTPIPN